MKLKNQITINITFLFLLAIFTLNLSGNVHANPQEDIFEEFSDDYVPDKHKECSTCSSVQGCETGQGATAPSWLKYGLLAFVLIGGTIFITRKFNWKLAALLLVLLALGFIPRKEACTSNSQNTNSILLTKISLPEQNNQVEPLEQDEFESLEQDELGDEFQEIADDEFSEFSEEVTAEIQGPRSIWQNRNFTLSMLVLFLTLIAGVLVRFKTTRKLKTFMLLSTMIYLGFINGACPCMISSFQNTLMYFIGVEVEPMLMLWFLGLIPLTYFFGKVWCGWVCHLGALQEFIFRPGVINVLKDQKSQKVLKWIRIVSLAILILQIMVTRTNIFIHYDPFKVAYNLFSANTLGYILLIIMLVSSILIYRPFCRAFCPVGLILGWVSMLPGATTLNKKEGCIDCKACSSACRYNAMIYENKMSLLNNEDCMLCGDCMDTCNFSSLEISRNKIVRKLN